MLTKNQVLDAIKKSLVLYKREILDNEYSTRKYVDDGISNINEFTNKLNDRIGLKTNNSISVAEIISVAKSYYNVRTKEDGTPLFTYDTGHTALSDNYDPNNVTYAGAIDCSTYIGLVLRGIPFLKSPYSHLVTGVEDDPNSDLKEDNVTGDEIGDDGVDSEVWNPSLIVENKNDYPWAINPFNWKLPATQSSSPTPIRRASQLAQWMFERGMSIPLDETFSNLEPGDIIFWAKTNSDGNYVQPNRYKHISHVALCIGKYDPPTDDVNFPTGYPFKHTMLETTTIAPYVLNRTLEKVRPNEVVMICRPDLGSLSTENFAGNIKNQWGIDDISELYRPGIYYLTSSVTKGLPDNITNGIYLTLKVERTMTKQGKTYSLIQTLINAKTNDSVYRRTQYCYSHLPNKTSWTPWKALDTTNEYVLPIANQTTLGGIKVGAGLSITAEGVLSATGGGTADSVNWENVVGRPTFATVAISGSYNDLTNKPTIPTVTNDLTNALKSNYDTAYTHSQAAHAPSNAQKNSDITKSEIEAKLTGDITTHTHSQYLTSIPSEYITEQELTSKGYATATTHEEVKTTVNQILGGAYIE